MEKFYNIIIKYFNLNIIYFNNFKSIESFENI